MENGNVELRKTVERLKKINEIGRMLSSIIETGELARTIIRTTAELLDAERAVMYLKEARKPAMTILYESGIIRNVPDCPPVADPDSADPLTCCRKVFFQDGDRSPNGSRIGVPLKMRSAIIGAVLLEKRTGAGPFAEDEIELLTIQANQATAALENALLYENLKNNYFSTVQSLVNALEASDRFTRGHSERVRMLSLALGKRLGLDYQDLELLEQAAILHDIGKIGIDNIILRKQGKLTGREYSLVKTHPLIGDEILGPIKTLEDVRKTILQHHERHDGTGYPYGLKGDEICLKSKILSVVDTFDAMMTDRPYRKALSVSAVIGELRKNAGTQFDSSVVDAFVDMLDDGGDEFLSAAGYNTLFSPF
jgi:putative nucleotidyltransferase with HDIG domain